MKKNDWILLGIVFAVAACFFGIWLLKPESEKKQVEVTVDKKFYGTYRLDEDQTIDISGMNVLVIENGHVKMKEASCPDLLCVHHKAIAKDGESIICLPNKIVVTIRGEEENTVDAMTN